MGPTVAPVAPSSPANHSATGCPPPPPMRGRSFYWTGDPSADSQRSIGYGREVELRSCRPAVGPRIMRSPPAMRVPANCRPLLRQLPTGDPRGPGPDREGLPVRLPWCSPEDPDDPVPNGLPFAEAVQVRQRVYRHAAVRHALAGRDAASGSQSSGPLTRPAAVR